MSSLTSTFKHSSENPPHATYGAFASPQARRYVAKIEWATMKYLTRIHDVAPGSLISYRLHGISVSS